MRLRGHLGGVYVGGEMLDGDLCDVPEQIITASLNNGHGPELQIACLSLFSVHVEHHSVSQSIDQAQPVPALLLTFAPRCHDHCCNAELSTLFLLFPEETTRTSSAHSTAEQSGPTTANFCLSVSNH